MKARAQFGLQTGLTITELMISLSLGMLISLAAIALFLSSRIAYSSVDETARLQESGSFALDVIARAVRQSAYVHWEKPDAPIGLPQAASANLAGLDAKGQQGSIAGMNSGSAAVNSSDVLAVGFFGAGTGDNGDGSIVNCAGFGVPAPTVSLNPETQRGWSIFYIDRNDAGEAELRCKYNARTGATTSWTTDALLTGIESLQVLYGIDTTGNGDAEQFMSADAVNALDRNIAVVGTTDEAKAADRNRKSFWKKVVAVKVAVLVSSSKPARVELPVTVFDLFGPMYSKSTAATSDSGATFDESKLAENQRNRLRKIFRTTILLRNAGNGGPT